MMLCYSLNKNVACEKICKDISELITKISSSGENLSELVLIIDIKSTIDNSQSLLPRLEYKK